MGLRILSFFNENVTWRIAQTSEGFYHRESSGVPEWLPGIPSGMKLEVVESTFEQFSSTDNSLQPTNLSFKLTYRVGHSNEEWFIFSSSDDDTFSVKIPLSTFATLQEAFPSRTLPRMRIARLVLLQAIHLGLLSVELLPETPLYQTIQSQVSQSFAP